MGSSCSLWYEFRFPLYCSTREVRDSFGFCVGDCEFSEHCYIARILGLGCPSVRCWPRAINSVMAARDGVYSFDHSAPSQDEAHQPMREKLFIGILLLILASPCFALADSRSPNSNVWNPSILNGPLVVCTGTLTPAITLPDGTVTPYIPPCNSLCDLIAQIANVIYFMIAIILWIVAPVLVTVGGIMIMLAGANPGLIETGKKTVTGVVWGVVIVLCAWLIVKTVVTNFGISGVGGFSTSSSTNTGILSTCKA